MRRPRRLVIDWTRCDGHALCARLFPELVTLDEWGFPRISERTVDGGELRTARRAVLACPALALRLEKVTSAAEPGGTEPDRPVLPPLP